MYRQRPLRLLTLAALVAACGGPLDQEGTDYGNSSEAVSGTCPSGATTPGIDVSDFDGTINWSQVAGSGIKFAYAKATEGLTFTASTFQTNWSGMKTNGVLRGAYHFFHSGDDGTAQADAFLKVVGLPFQSGDLPPMLDWETNDSGVSVAQAVAQAQKFIDEIKAKTGQTTIIYTYPDFWNNTLHNPSQFGSYPFWIATYQTTQSTTSYTPPSGFCPNVLSPWSSWAIWQWSSTGTTVPSIPMDVDMDVFNGSLTQLQQFASTMGSTPPPASMPLAQMSGNEAITIVNWPDKHIDLFAKASDGTMKHTYAAAGSDTWASPAELDTGAECGSAAAFWGGNWSYPELFSPLSSGSSGHLWWASSTSWTKYQSFGGSQLAHFSTAVGLDGRSEVFALGSDHAIWTNYWNTTTSNWSGWKSLGGSFVTGAGAITWGNGTVELFATDSAGIVWHMWSDHTGAAGWSAWTKMGGSGLASRPVPVRWSDGMAGHAEVFVRGTDGQLYHSNYSYSTDWPAFTVVSPGSQIIGQVSAIMNPGNAGAPQGPEVFARDTLGRVVHLSWNGSSYSSFSLVGNEVTASDPFGWTRADGTAEVFAIDDSGNLTRAYRNSSGSWSSWGSIGSGFDACAEPVPPPSEMDAGMPVQMDAGMPVKMDAGVPASDGGSSHTDGGVDAGTTNHSPDAGSSSNTPIPSPTTTGCACSGRSTALVVAPWVALALAARRRRRS